MIIIVCVVFILQAKDEKHRNEITNVIESKGGLVISIESSRKSLSPFKDFSKKRANKNDDYYFVKYSIEKQTKTAWFKGDNALYRDPPTPDTDKWIFE
ncbi:hypothetical protein [Paenibacillus radicis (ex Xue et al. 2023)]|uniref:Uncharacterized protein n=1 Tax=Paenibacillus radicis (ex Xue et al. 2023) TaxID=2972489 RepID=A0ABT1YR52_9BACL|nr:hypothetical protein [Paenibacillus radicis (ex Xue et al. 2023)]MCR8635646.1 hypothetical protein [Paenibacillus radicis (ex Xue et al. 2023)]